MGCSADSMAIADVSANRIWAAPGVGLRDRLPGRLDRDRWRDPTSSASPGSRVEPCHCPAHWMAIDDVTQRAGRRRHVASDHATGCPAELMAIDGATERAARRRHVASDHATGCPAEWMGGLMT